MKLNELPVRLGRLAVSLLLIPLALISIQGCGGSNTTGPARLVPLTLKAAGTGAPGTGARAAALAGTFEPMLTATGDTIPVTFTSAYLVVRDVRFKIADGGPTDTTGMGDESDTTGVGETDSTDDDAGEPDSAGMIRFNGPFAIDLLTSTSQTLDTEMVPPGVYRRVQGHLAALSGGTTVADSFPFLVGATVYLEGTVDGEGGGPFTYKARIDDEFMIRGAFTVDADTPATAFIVFDVSHWLVGPDGQFLDPRIPDNDKWIQWSIRHSIKACMDDNHDGEVDDPMHAAE
jgi:hypothetical protein